jgi:hypothetical protein
MKKKDIYEVTIKFIGIIATCKFIESLIAAGVVYITFHLISTNIKFDFMGISQTNYSVFYIFPIMLYGLFGYLLLFKTDKILNIFRLNDSSEATLQVEKKTVYHIAVLIIGFFILTYSGNQLVSNTFYKAEETTTQQTSTSQNTTLENNKAIVSTSTITSPKTSFTVNYMNILIFLLSILIIIKSEKLSGILMPKVKEELID